VPRSIHLTGTPTATVTTTTTSSSPWRMLTTTITMLTSSSFFLAHPIIIMASMSIYQEEEEAAGSFVRLNCYASKCNVIQVIPFGKHGKHGGEVGKVDPMKFKFRTREEAIQLAFTRMRKHARNAFMAEQQPGGVKNAMPAEAQQFWKEQLAGQNNFGSKALFQEWEMEHMVPKCGHHPWHRSQVPWRYRVHTCSCDRSNTEEEEKEETVEVNYYPSLTSHWPLVHRQDLVQETAVATSKKRKSLQWLLAHAAVRGYKRFCKIEGKAPVSESEAKAQWVEKARTITKAYVDLARLESKGRGKEHMPAPVSPGMEHSLCCILNSADMHTTIGIGLQDIDYPPP